MASLDGKTALITGAGSGIGRASALRMATDGARIMCTDLDGESAEATALVIQQEGGEAASLAVDVTEEKDVIAAIETTASTFGDCRIIFNNAGIGGGGAGWHKTISVNLTGVYYGLVHGAKYLADTGGGSIVNTASVAGLLGLSGPGGIDVAIDPADGRGAYVAAKHGVVGLTRQFALTYARSGVRVNAIAPGYIETPMTAGIRDIPDGQAFMESMHPMGRLGQPEEIAAVAAFLASDDASFVTGVVMPVDGGYTAK